MLSSDVLEVAIGLTSIYLLLSLICSTLTEFVSGIFAMRARDLEANIRKLLSDPSGSGLAKQFYAHPLIAGASAQRRLSWFPKNGGKPSYVGARNFALTLLDIVAPANGNQSATLASVRAAVAQCQNVDVRRVLLSLTDAGGNSLEAARKNVEMWFDGAMDRLSGVYKRKAQLIALGIALLLSVAFRLDTFAFIATLQSNPALRAAVVQVAQEQAKPIAQGETEDVQGTLEKLTAQVRAVELSQLPIGWSASAATAGASSCPNCTCLSILGILLTTIAISLGAPFWFELLNKLINLRAAGQKPEKSQAS